MLSRYVEQLLNIYNYIDGIIITDKDGYCRVLTRISALI